MFSESDPDRPLTPTEENAHRSQGEAIRFALAMERKEQEAAAKKQEQEGQ